MPRRRSRSCTRSARTTRRCSSSIRRTIRKVVGDLAESWTVSPDGLTYTFKLRRNVKFHDGSPMTSEDIKATYERLRKPPPGVQSIREETFKDITTIDTPDPYTVVFKLAAHQRVDALELRLAVGLRLQRRQAQDRSQVPGAQHHGHGPRSRSSSTRPDRIGSGKKFDGYFEAGKPYLDGYRAVFISGAPMVNALAGGQVLTEFRGQSPADRDRLVQALGDKAVVVESPWVCSLVVSFNTKKKPFDDPRVRRALSLAVDRWQGAEALQKIALVRHVGGLLRPGYEFAISEQDLLKQPGFSRDINASRAEAKRLLERGGRREPLVQAHEPQRCDALHAGRRVPDRPVAPDRPDRRPRAAGDAPLSRRAAAGNATYDAALDFNCDFMDEPNLQLQKYLSADKSALNYSGHIDRKLDEIYDKQAGELDKAKRTALLREFETRALAEAYVIPTIWWHRIIVYHKQMKGWHITPSHYVGQDLTDVWLDR
jgi:peptide/nickel transport system substrate-binding protein